MAVLGEIGPDTLIPHFAVNLEGNKDVARCNRINDYVFKHLVHPDEDMNTQRTPMIVTASTTSLQRHSNAPNHFKTRPGVRLQRWKTRAGFPPGSDVPFEHRTHLWTGVNSNGMLGMFGCTETFKCKETLWAALSFSYWKILTKVHWRFLDGRKNRYNAGKKS